MKAKKKIMLALLGLSVASGVGLSPTFSVDAAKSPELILHGDYGGGASTHGTVHSIKYDKQKNEYYVTRNSSGVMNRVSGEAFETKDMKDSANKLDEAVENRKQLSKSEAEGRYSADQKIQEKIDNSKVLTYDDDSHGDITLGGENGTVLSNVSTDENDETSLANGAFLAKLDESIAKEKEEQQEALAQEASERDEADKALSDRLGTISASETTHYVDSKNSASDNLLSLDSQIKKNSDTLNANIQHRKDLTDAEYKAQVEGDADLWDKLGELDKNGNYISSDASASSNIKSLDDKLGEISKNTNNFDKKRNNAVSSEKKAREEADKALSDRIGTISSDAKVTYIKKDATVVDNLKNLDQAAKDNNDALEKEIQNRLEAIDNLSSSGDQKLAQAQNEITETGAKVAAISNLKYADYKKGQKTSFSIGIGTYRSKTAGALGVKHYFNRDIAANAAVTTGNKTMANAGVAARIRMDTPELKELREIKEEMASLSDDNDKLEQEIFQLKHKGGVR